MSTVEANRALYERFCREVLERGNLSAIDELVDANVVSHAPFPGQAPGRAGFKQALAEFRAAFPELKVRVRDLIASEEKVVGYFSVEGVQRAAFMGIEASGQTIQYEEMVIVRIAEGKIVEHWSVSDTLAMMQSLGAVGPVAAPEETEASRAQLSEPQRKQVRDFFARYAERFNQSLAGQKVEPNDERVPVL